MLFHGIEKNKKNIAIYLNKNNSILYQDIIKKSDEFLKNIKERSLIILIGENNVETFLAYISLMRSSNLLMILDPNTKIEDINLIIKKYLPTYIYCSKKKGKLILKNNFNVIYSHQTFDLLEAKTTQKYEIYDDLKILLSTSGSLGEPRFVKLSNENLKSNTESIISYLKLNASDRTITTMPMSYSYGLSVINTHLFCGASIVLNDSSIVDKKFWELYSDSLPSNINGVPFFYDLLIRIGFNRVLNPNLKFITQAGGKLRQKSFKKISEESIKNNFNFFLMYGQTEASPRISFHKVANKDLELDNPPIGKAIPGGEIFLKDEKNIVINEKNKDGEIYFTGKNIFGGYSSSYQDLKDFNFLKELKTGDIGYKDSNNNFFISGRKGRFVKVYGYRLNLDFIQEKFNNKGYSVACLGLKDILYIFSLKKISEIEKIIDLPKDSFKIIILKKFPLNSNGKISYTELIKKIL